MESLKVLFVASEVVPFTKTGGLADVIGSLPQELRNKGIDARVITPYYKGMYRQKVEEEGEWLSPFIVHVGWRQQETNILKHEDEVTTYFIKNEYYFYRDEVYGYEDDHERYAYFCRAVLDLLPHIDFIPDVIHCNDWQAGPVCLLLKDYYSQDLRYKDIKSIFTIHNIQYQGIFGVEALEVLGVSQEYFCTDKLEYNGAVSYMKAGILYSDIITTVSPSYAKEIQTAEYGYGLDGLLRSRSDVVYGIINGIDYGKYNPSTDTYIYKNYSLQEIRGKKINKQRFQEEFGLEQKDCMVIAIITRLAVQKGIDLLKETIDGIWLMDKLMEKDVQFILLGTGEPEYEDMFRHFACKYEGRTSIHFTFNEALAQKIYAASDIFLMPSLFEPCGLGQLMAMKYGSVPIVRKTGGLKDTVTHYNYLTGEGTGFEFEEYSGYWLYNKICEAYALYTDNPIGFEKLRANGMKAEYGWSNSAKEYIELYEEVVASN